uniref:Uncharacterized protein n=1 Tax=Meloidogyne enterolobii TaxID=390850 RepID=A0A6V7VYF8_MELEN|nr:unnamed protein product [Meloidogyne enterolobii]
MILNNDKYQTLNSEGNQQLNNNNHFDVLRDYIIKLQMLYIHRFSIFDNPEVSKEDKISQSEIHQPLHEGQGERHGTKTLSQLSSDVEENNLKLFEMRELIGDYKAQQSSNNFYGKISTILISLSVLFLFYRILRSEHVFNHWKDMEKLRVLTPIEPV